MWWVPKCYGEGRQQPLSQTTFSMSGCARRMMKNYM